MALKEQELRIKVVAVGDGAVGKTCLLVCYSKGVFPEDYIPTIFDNYHAKVKFEDKTVGIDIWDTAGQEDYDKMRVLSYPETDVFLICFSIVDPTSFENVGNKWVPELKTFCRDNSMNDVKVILVGTKLDLREDSETLRELKKDDLVPVTREAADKLANEIGAECYIETSAKNMRGVKETFVKAIEIVVNHGDRGGGKLNDEPGSGLFSSISGGKTVQEDVANFLK